MNWLELTLSYRNLASLEGRVKTRFLEMTGDEEQQRHSKSDLIAITATKRKLHQSLISAMPQYNMVSVYE